MPRKFIPGSILELAVDANCIPAGRYRFEREEDEFLMFSVGSRISFGLCKRDYEPLLKDVDQPNQLQTSSETFVERYAELFSKYESGTPTPTPTTGMTFCAMDPSVQRKFMRLHRQKKKHWNKAFILNSAVKESENGAAGQKHAGF